MVSIMQRILWGLEDIEFFQLIIILNRNVLWSLHRLSGSSDLTHVTMCDAAIILVLQFILSLPFFFLSLH